MPIYEFTCSKCETKFEKLMKRMGSDEQPACPKCGSAKTDRALSVFAVNAEGSRPDAPAGGMCGCGKVPGSCGMN